MWTLAKRFPLWSERRSLTFRAEFYDLPNHTQFSGINNTLQYELGSYRNWIQGKGDLVQATISSDAIPAPALRARSL